jgi:hypothetical protein
MRWIKPTNLWRYCPFKDRGVLERNLFDEIFVTAQWIYLCSKSSLSGIAQNLLDCSRELYSTYIRSGNFKDDLSYTPLRNSMAGSPSQCESENSEQLVRQCLHLPPEHAGAGSPGYGGGIGFSPRYGAHGRGGRVKRIKTSSEWETCKEHCYKK